MDLEVVPTGFLQEVLQVATVIDTSLQGGAAENCKTKSMGFLLVYNFEPGQRTVIGAVALLRTGVLEPIIYESQPHGW